MAESALVRGFCFFGERLRPYDKIPSCRVVRRTVAARVERTVELVTDEDVMYVARLAKIKFDEKDLGRYSDQLSTILNHIDKISELDLSEVEPTSHVLKLANVFREDAERPSVPREDALANGPEVESGAFRVPPILEADDESA